MLKIDKGKESSFQRRARCIRHYSFAQSVWLVSCGQDDSLAQGVVLELGVTLEVQRCVPPDI